MTNRHILIKYFSNQHLSTPIEVSFIYPDLPGKESMFYNWNTILAGKF